MDQWCGQRHRQPVVSDRVRIVSDKIHNYGNTLANRVRDLGNGIANRAREVDKVINQVDSAVTGAINTAADAVWKIPVTGDLFGTIIQAQGQDPFSMLKLASKITGDIGALRFESAFDSQPEGIFYILRSEIRKILQALILHTVVADTYLFCADGNTGRRAQRRRLSR